MPYPSPLGEPSIWDSHPRHGQQFIAEVCEQELPSTAPGIESYLGCGMVKGIGMGFKTDDRIAQALRLVSPTGRAAKRLAEATGQPASTSTVC